MGIIFLILTVIIFLLVGGVRIDYIRTSAACFGTVSGC